MSDPKKLSHDILNSLERLRIMHELVKEKNFGVIPKDEIVSDFEVELKKIAENFRELLNQ